MAKTIYFWVFIISHANGFIITPEDVAMAITTFYGFAPRIFTGNDHRFGFGFKFGEHADLQILYEIGPQSSTKPLQELQIISAPSRRRQVRRPFLELLLRAGLLHSYRYSIVHEVDKKPR